MDPGRVVEIITQHFGYRIHNMSGVGVVLTRPQAPPIVVPMGAADIDEEIINHIISKAPFSREQFWNAAHGLEL